MKYEKLETLGAVKHTHTHKHFTEKIELNNNSCTQLGNKRVLFIIRKNNNMKKIEMLCA